MDGRLFLFLVFLMVTIFVIGCNRHIDKLSTEGFHHRTWFQKIQATTITPRCLKCHSGPSARGGIQLDSYAHLMESRTKDGTPLITPNNCDSSGLIRVLRAGTMPPSGRLDAAELLPIEKWVDAGASEKAPLPEPQPIPIVSPIVTPVPEPILDPEKPAPTFRYLSTHVFKQCLDCHSPPEPQNDLDFSSYSSLMKSKKIVAGAPEDSDLYQRLIKVDDPMPPESYPALPSSVVDLIHNWILQGAKDN